MKMVGALLALVVAALAAACPAVEPPPSAVDAGADLQGLPADPARMAQCFSCHTDVQTDFARASSHALLFDCDGCHVVHDLEGGAGHAERPQCSQCHSQAPHPSDYACVTCHAPHGSENAFLLRASIPRPDGSAIAVHVTLPEGATADGLVRAGVDGQSAGTGLCEACHTSTAYYTSDGAGAAHHSQWCGQCHSHQHAFAPPAQ